MAGGQSHNEGSRGSQGKAQSGQGGNVDPGGAGMTQEEAQRDKAEESGRRGGEDADR